LLVNCDGQEGPIVT